MRILFKKGIEKNKTWKKKLLTTSTIFDKLCIILHGSDLKMSDKNNQFLTVTLYIQRSPFSAVSNIKFHFSFHSYRRTLTLIFFRYLPVNLCWRPSFFQFPGHLRGVRVEIFCVSIKCYFSVKNPFFFHIFEIPIS